MSVTVAQTVHPKVFLSPIPVLFQKLSEGIAMRGDLLATFHHLILQRVPVQQLQDVSDCY